MFFSTDKYDFTITALQCNDTTQLYLFSQGHVNPGMHINFKVNEAKKGHRKLYGYLLSAQQSDLVNEWKSRYSIFGKHNQYGRGSIIRFDGTVFTVLTTWRTFNSQNIVEIRFEKVFHSEIYSHKLKHGQTEQVRREQQPLIKYNAWCRGDRDTILCAGDFCGTRF